MFRQGSDIHLSGKSVQDMRLKENTEMPQVSQTMVLKLLPFMRCKSSCSCLRHLNLIGRIEVRSLHLAYHKGSEV